ncbi:MAG: EVE domain-containing protein [bacterium]|nr:EVE domain-containing protein [bacterium]
MKYWLLKTEPTVYSYDDLVMDKRTVWDGVASPAGIKNIKSIKKGDLAFVYHTGDEKKIVGIGEAVSDSYPDPKDSSGKFFVFEIKPVRNLNIPVTLAQVKADQKYSTYQLVREPRLSVMEVPENYWNDFLKMSE